MMLACGGGWSRTGVCYSYENKQQSGRGLVLNNYFFSILSSFYNVSKGVICKSDYCDKIAHVEVKGLCVKLQLLSETAIMPRRDVLATFSPVIILLPVSEAEEGRHLQDLSYFVTTACVYRVQARKGHPLSAPFVRNKSTVPIYF